MVATPPPPALFQVEIPPSMMVYDLHHIVVFKPGLSSDAKILHAVWITMLHNEQFFDDEHATVDTKIIGRELGFSDERMALVTTELIQHGLWQKAA